jgi:hypothetical protein
MKHRRAFALRDSIDAETFGGSFAMPDGSTFRVDDALREQNGIIVTDDPPLIDALSAYIAVKEVPVPKDQTGYDGMTVEQLDAELSTRENVTLAADAKKSDKIAALYADDQRRIDEQTANDAAAAAASIENAEEGAQS